MPLGRADLFDILARLGLATTTVDHPAVFTVAESHKIKQEIPGGHTKNLFLKDKKDQIFLVVAESDAALNLKTLHEVIGANGRVTFGKPELMLDLLGVVPGSVTPFGVINDPAQRITVVLDRPMMDHAILNYHPLENTATTSIAAADLVTFLRATGHEPRILQVSHGKLDLEAGEA